jgi:formylglycine-generating enzyme required for sulfatase activity
MTVANYRKWLLGVALGTVVALAALPQWGAAQVAAPVGAPPVAVAKETAVRAELTRQAKIAELLGIARANDNKENGQKALTALEELLKLDAGNAEGKTLQAKISAYYGPRKVTNTLGMALIEIKAGTFTMGTPAEEAGHWDDEGPPHKVTLTKGFYVGVHHVTVGQFRKFVEAANSKTEAEAGDGAYVWDGKAWSKDANANWKTPGFAQADDHPVVCVSWNDAQAFIKWLSKKEGKSYRLPTEAELEYCCRAGTTTAYPWGDNPDDGKGWANCPDLTAKKKFPTLTTFNWRDGFVYTSPVGSFKPNAFGLYDMIGNAWQWCGDRLGKYPTDPQADPTGDANGTARVLRGGSWSGNPRYCRSGYRTSNGPAERFNDFGFRVVLDSN